MRDSKQSAEGADPAQATSKLSEGTSKAHQAIKEGFERAYSELSGAISKHGGSASRRTLSIASLMAADVVFSEAQEFYLLLVNYKIEAETDIDRIIHGVRQVDSFEGQKGMLEKLLAGVEKEASDLQDILESGVSGSEGLKELLESERAKLSDLQAEKQKLEREMGEQQDKANEIESKASAMLKEAESLSNSHERLMLEKEAFGLQLSKKSYLSQYQSIVDSLALIESKILISEPMVQKYENDVKDFSDKIAAIKSSTRESELKKQLDQIGGQISQYRQEIGNLLELFGQKRGRYIQLLEEIAGLYGKAVEEYDVAAKSSKMKDFARERSASSRLRLGSLYSGSVRFHEDMVSRMRYVKDTSAINGSGDFTSTMNQCSELSIDHREKSYAMYDLAIEGFGELSGGGEFSCTALKNNILALYGKAELATYLGDVALTDESREGSYAVSDEAVEEAEKLLPRAEECDPDFSESVTARLLKGGDDFVPQMSVDLTGYYSDIRDRHFGDWTKLKGRAKLRRIEELLDLIAELEPPTDPVAFDQIILPEKRLLEDALTASLDADFSGGDPNF